MNKNKRRKESKQYKMSRYNVLQGVKVIVTSHAVKGLGKEILNIVIHLIRLSKK